LSEKKLNSEGGMMKTDIIITAMLTILCFLLVTIVPCQADNNVFYGCAQKKKGNLRLVSDPSECKKSEYSVTLSSGVNPYDELKAFATGTITSYGSSGCQSSSEGCTITDQGTVEGNIIHNGTFTHSAVVLWTQSSPNGSGGICAPASGMLNITTPNGSTLTIQRTGTLCEVGMSGSSNYTFNSTYFITDGTKDFAGASGTGILICSVDSSGNVQGFAHGTINY
jgi:hypothetical protein